MVVGGGTVTYESAAVELDGTHRMIHESWPQGFSLIISYYCIYLGEDMLAAN